MTTFINFISNQLLHTQHNKADGREFVSVSLPLSGSLNGFGTFAVSPKQILPAKKKDGTVVDGFSNILLGDPDRTRKVSVCIGENEYANIQASNAEITRKFDAEREAWKAANTVPAAAEA